MDRLLHHYHHSPPPPKSLPQLFKASHGVHSLPVTDRVSILSAALYSAGIAPSNIHTALQAFPHLAGITVNHWLKETVCVEPR